MTIFFSFCRNKIWICLTIKILCSIKGILSFLHHINFETGKSNHKQRKKAQWLASMVASKLPQWKYKRKEVIVAAYLIHWRWLRLWLLCLQYPHHLLYFGVFDLKTIENLCFDDPDRGGHRERKRIWEDRMDRTREKEDEQLGWATPNFWELFGTLLIHLVIK